MAATPLLSSTSRPMLSGVPAAVEYIELLLEEAPGILTGAVNQALAEEVDYVRGRAAYTEHAQMAHQFDIRTEGADFVYGFTAEHGMRDPRTGRFMSWKQLEYGEQGFPATGFLRSAVVNRERQLGQRITQLITEVL